jgi:glucose-1-phosphate adenylyltransferase
MKIRAVILAGGEGSRLGVLTAKRAKPAVPFGGKYRIIDFTLSNCVNSGIFDVMILTQYRPHSLNEHIGLGRPWDLDRGFTGGVQIYQPYRGRADTDWYRGTADAIRQNIGFVKRGNPDLILVLSGDHIYQMNYDSLIAFHAQREADLTIASLTVSREEARRMGVLATDADDRVIRFFEKPEEPPETRASMGIYVFGLATLERVLAEDGRRRDSSHDFGKDVVPRMVKEGAWVCAFPYLGFWVDVGTIEAYWRTHMDLLRNPTPLDLNSRSWIIHTRSEERPPVRIEKGAVIEDSLITDGCVIGPRARIERCVLSPGVHVEPGAVLRESVILTDTVVGAGARIERAIVDKSVAVGKGSILGALQSSGGSLAITTVGKGARIPPGARVEPGAVIEADSVVGTAGEEGSGDSLLRRGAPPRHRRNSGLPQGPGRS